MRIMLYNRSLLVSHKRDSGEILPLFHIWDTRKSLQLGGGLHSNMLASWSQTSSLRTKRNTFLLFRSHPAYGILLLQPNELKFAEDQGFVLFIIACTLNFPVSYPTCLELGDCPYQVLSGLWSRSPSCGDVHMCNHFGKPFVISLQLTHTLSIPLEATSMVGRQMSACLYDTHNCCCYLTFLLEIGHRHL